MPPAANRTVAAQLAKIASARHFAITHNAAGRVYLPPVIFYRCNKPEIWCFWFRHRFVVNRQTADIKCTGHLELKHIWICARDDRISHRAILHAPKRSVDYSALANKFRIRKVCILCIPIFNVHVIQIQPRKTRIFRACPRQLARIHAGIVKRRKLLVADAVNTAGP